MAESWCKVDSNLDNHPKIRKAGNFGRQVFEFALRRNAMPGNPVPGLLPGSMLEPWFLADQLMMSEADAATGLAKAIAAELLIKDNGAYRLPGWDETWGRKPKSGAERQAEFRARKRGDITRTEKKTYAIEQVGYPFVKIGRAANITSRLYDLQVASPVPLRLLRFSLRDVEGELHAKLSPHRASGEWFHRNSEVDAIVNQLLEITGDGVESNGESVTGNETGNGELPRGEERRGDHRSRSTRTRTRGAISEDWKPRDEERRYAAEMGLDCDSEAAEFKAYWLGDGRPKKNWDQTFRNRLISQSKRVPRWSKPNTEPRRIDDL